MYRFLMVDDEDLVRRGFEARIDWEAQGFSFLPPAENGRDAMLAIEELGPDVVMTDICMPHADGIALAAWIAEKHPAVTVVVLSGYDEFGYAQAAIKHRVFEYVLKPVTARDLEALLGRIKAKLDTERREEAEGLRLRVKAEASDRLLRDRRLLEWLSAAGGASGADFASALLGFDTSRLAVAALAILPESGAPDAEALRERLDLAARRAPGRSVSRDSRSLSFTSQGGLAGALFFGREAEDAERKARGTAEALLAESPGQISPSLGGARPADRGCPEAWKAALAALDGRLLGPPRSPFRFRPEGSGNRAGLEEARFKAERLILALRQGRPDASREAAGAWLSALEGAELPSLSLRGEVEGLLARAGQALRGDLGASALPGGLESQAPSALPLHPRSEDVFERVEALARLACLARETRSLGEQDWKILDFKELVARRFAEADFSIALAASRLGISESYLSKLLRRKLGLSFVDYLSAYRVEEAKALLLSSDMPIYEVAEAVGVPDSRYFGSIFKRLTGLTLSEYRDRGELA